MNHRRSDPPTVRPSRHGRPGLPTAGARASVALAALAVLAALALRAGTAAAGPLADPTRPPAALMAPGGLAAAALPHQANRDTARAIAAAQRAADPPPPPAPVLVQSVQLPARSATGAATGTAVALVDGRLVTVGDALDGRTVLAIDAQGLLVKGPRGPERLWLLGGAAKQAAGSITQSRTARYQPAPDAGTGTAAGPGAPATAGAEPAALPPGREPVPGLPANTSAATAPMSLAKRTAP